MGQQNRTEYKRAFNERTYDRLAITVPRGRKGVLQAFARQRGETVNSMTNRLYRAELGLTGEAWKRGDLREE